MKRPEHPASFFFKILLLSSCAARVYPEALLSAYRRVKDPLRARVSALPRPAFAGGIRPALAYVSYAGGSCGAKASYIARLRQELEQAR